MVRAPFPKEGERRAFTHVEFICVEEYSRVAEKLVANAVRTFSLPDSFEA